ncbi:SMAD/FHA domain-containing protein [Clohesyomyces aquaticus]|uniref:SMAD/FHA domain-containing protein n=1 Tax=Clohesyomyces aquaticus TaxID=1231657 RepID=A0A1Y1ZR74_9PLEO|nr:SMAD/FHA domain-containing protein [Clohesyomyces aquaticus]
MSRSRPGERKPKESKHTSRSRSQERKSRAVKETSRERKRDGSREPYKRPRDTSRDRVRDQPREKDKDRLKESDRYGSIERRRDRSRDRRRDRSRNRDGRKDPRRERSQDRHSRKSASPLPYRPSKRRDRSPSPPRRHRRDSRSPTPNKSKRRKVPSRSPSPPPARSRKPLPSQEVSFRGLDNSDQPPTKYGGMPPDKEKPNFAPTGLLAKEANTVAGTKIALKYHEPPEARKPPPSAQWRVFVFKGPDVLSTIELHTQSCWLLGRAQEVADIVLGHPSSSQQHAAIQFRYITKVKEDEYGISKKTGKVKPYIIDLESSNGTELNGEKLEAGRYYELRDKDMMQFGGSEREYVIMLPPPEK